MHLEDIENVQIPIHSSIYMNMCTYMYKVLHLHNLTVIILQCNVV